MQTPEQSIDYKAIFAESLIAPRSSMRRLLDSGIDEQHRMTMVLLSGVLYAIVFSVIQATTPLPEEFQEVSGLLLAVMFVGLSLISYLIIGFLVKWIGGLFGGEGTVEDCKTAVAWYMLISEIVKVCILPLDLILPAFIGAPLAYAVSGYLIFMFANYISEAHRFKTAYGACAVLFGLFALLIYARSSIIANMPAVPA